MELVLGVGGDHPSGRSGPEPAVDVLGEEVGPVAAVEVAQAAGSPEAGNVGTCGNTYE